MIEWVQRIEDKLVRLETWALVLCVVAMLLLAGYNVLYRNALIPLQNYLRSTGPPVTQQRAPTSESGEESSESGETESEESSEDRDDGAGGFGGGFGGGESENGDQKTDDGGDESNGFEGGFGGGESEDGDDGEKQKLEGDESSSDDGGSGFEGGFGGGDEEKTGKGSGEKTDETEGFGGGFGGEPSGAGNDTGTEAGGANTASGESRVASREPKVKAEPEYGPPPEGSLADGLIEFINVIKLSWIDILLRQMVLIVGFLGAMLAARRREHITIDAVGQIVTGRTRDAVDAGTSTFAALICAVLALAGWDFVELGMKYPRELVPWAEQWTFQLMFPIGFGLTALHFALRAVESGASAFRAEESEESGGSEESDERIGSDEGEEETGGEQ